MIEYLFTFRKDHSVLPSAVKSTLERGHDVSVQTQRVGGLPHLARAIGAGDIQAGARASRGGWLVELQRWRGSGSRKHATMARLTTLKQAGRGIPHPSWPSDHRPCSKE